jgi:hypothetical protein
MAYTLRDLATKLVAQGLLGAAGRVLLRVTGQFWEAAGEQAARELMRSLARRGDLQAAVQ